jgi:hypothetical protein
LNAVEDHLVWLVGSHRSGSTWLLNLLSAFPGIVKIDEIGIGPHLGVFTADVLGTPPPGEGGTGQLFYDARRAEDDYFFSDRYASAWRPELRRLLLCRLRAQILDRCPDARRGGAVAVVKEPVGSQAAELLTSVLPASRLLVLMRDGRDVVDSIRDAMGQGAWLSTTYGEGRSIAAGERLPFVEVQAVRWVARTTAVLRAYDAHDPERRHLVRYEDLLASTTPRLQGVLAWLGRDVDPADVERTVELLSVSNMPTEHRGSGRFVRSASPGGWRENLTPEEQEAVHRIMGATLARVGYEV